MVAAVIVVADEVIDLEFEIAWQIVVFQQDAVLERPMPALNFALGHGVIRRSTDMILPVFSEPVGKVSGDIA